MLRDLFLEQMPVGRHSCLLPAWAQGSCQLPDTCPEACQKLAAPDGYDGAQLAVMQT